MLRSETFSQDHCEQDPKVHGNRAITNRDRRVLDDPELARRVRGIGDERTDIADEKRSHPLSVVRCPIPGDDNSGNGKLDQGADETKPKTSVGSERDSAWNGKLDQSADDTRTDTYV